MENISIKDREILREIASRKAELASNQRNQEILKMWDALANGVRATPTVRLLYSNFTNEVITSRLRCEGNDARALEHRLLAPIVGRELFDDDTPVSPTLDVNLFTSAYPFSAYPKATRIPGSNGYHIEPLTDDI